MTTGHKKQWEFLKEKLESNALSHAYLFTGADGIGKKAFALELVKIINCRGENPPCQKCFSCLAIEKESFPDLLTVKSINSKSSIEDKKDNLEIDVGQIRDAQKFLNYKSYYGFYKSLIIENAERMNNSAQSCLLKGLEEPKGQSLIILISSKPDILLPTIFSRCQAVKFFKTGGLPENPEKLAKEENLLKDLLPVIGSNFADKFKYVKSIDFEKQNAGEIVQVFQKYLRHLLMVKIGTEKAGVKDAAFAKYSAEQIKKALELSEEISDKLIFTNASPKLALEILLINI